MSETVDPHVLWKQFDVLIGGLGGLNVRRMTSDESKDFDRFVEDCVKILSRVSPRLAEDFKASAPFFKSVGEVFMAKVNKAFGGILPSSGQVGVSLIEPGDIRYAVTPSAAEPAYSDYALNTWELSLTAGTPVYLLGRADAFYKARPTEGSRCALAIMKNGIIEVGTSPSLCQFIFQTEKITYPYLTVHQLVDQPVEPGRPIYQYNIPLGLPIFHDFGVKLAAMPRYSGTRDVRIIGVCFYERDHKATLKWIK
jgi:hypothetical protein